MTAHHPVTIRNMTAEEKVRYGYALDEDYLTEIDRLEKELDEAKYEIQRSEDHQFYLEELMKTGLSECKRARNSLNRAISEIGKEI